MEKQIVLSNLILRYALMTIYTVDIEIERAKLYI